jgi:hypothetical protein
MMEEWNDAVEVVKAVEAIQIGRTKKPEIGGQNETGKSDTRFWMLGC